MTIYADVPPDEFTPGESYALSTYGGKAMTKGGKGLTPVYVIREAEYGDYGGAGTVGIANYRHLRDVYETSLADEDEPTLDIAFTHGGYGHNAVIYRADQEPSKALAEILEQLNETSILDEDLHSQIEMELVDAAVGDEWREFLKEVAAPTINGLLALPDDALLDEDDIEERMGGNADPAIQAFYNLLQHSNGDWERIESSGTGSVSFDWKRMLQWVERKMAANVGVVDVEELNETFAPLLDLFVDPAPPEALQPLRFF